MQTTICLMLVAFGLGVDAKPSSALEVVTGVSFLVGAIGIARPAISIASSFAAAKMPFKMPEVRKIRR